MKVILEVFNNVHNAHIYKTPVTLLKVNAENHLVVPFLFNCPQFMLQLLQHVF